MIGVFIICCQNDSEEWYYVRLQVMDEVQIQEKILKSKYSVEDHYLKSLLKTHFHRTGFQLIYFLSVCMLVHCKSLHDKVRSI